MAIQSIDIADKTTLDSVKQDTTAILNGMGSGGAATPKLIIVDSDSSMAGRVLTIYDDNNLYSHTVTFPADDSKVEVDLDYLGTWHVSYTNSSSITVVKNVDVDTVGGVLLSVSATICSWATGSDAEIAQMVALADAGVINLADYWHVGDEREVTLSAMAATGVGESHVEQTVTLVLMHAGGKTLNTPTESGRTTCSFVVGLKDSLKEKGYMNSSNTNTGGWTSSARRTWCNSVFKGALPVNLAPIFKQFENKTSAGNQSTTINTDVDWFALPSEIEIFGSTTYSASGEGTQFTWYETAANRIKKVDGSAYTWWERSPYTSNTTFFCFVNSDGSATGSGASYTYGLAPFGCI